MSGPPVTGKIINPGGEDMEVCKQCGPWAIKAGKWEGRFFVLLAAHERALRLIEEAGRDC